MPSDFRVLMASFLEFLPKFGQLDGMVLRMQGREADIGNYVSVKKGNSRDIHC